MGVKGGPLEFERGDADRAGNLPPSLQVLIHAWRAAQPLSHDKMIRLWQDIRVAWNFSSNHLAGNSLSFSETQWLLLDGGTRGEHQIREYDELRGHDVAIEWVRHLANEARHISEGDVRDLNRLILKDGYWRTVCIEGEQERRIWVEPGQYKVSLAQTPLANSEKYAPASRDAVHVAMAEFLSWLGSELTAPTLNVLALLAQVHVRFGRIQPFEDGNGRVTRLLLNFVLLRKGLLPVVVPSHQFKRYEEVCATTWVGDEGELKSFFQELVECALKGGLAVAEGVDVVEV